MNNFTAIQDYTSQQVYEGDVLKVINFGEQWSNLPRLCVVITIYRSIWVIYQNQNKGHARLNEKDKYEKIGNIYDSPELWLKFTAKTRAISE